MSIETFATWCPYSDVFCQEREPCTNCNIYYKTMPVPERTLEEIKEE